MDTVYELRRSVLELSDTLHDRVSAFFDAPPESIRDEELHGALPVPVPEPVRAEPAAAPPVRMRVPKSGPAKPATDGLEASWRDEERDLWDMELRARGEAATRRKLYEETQRQRELQKEASQKRMLESQEAAADREQADRLAEHQAWTEATRSRTRDDDLLGLLGSDDDLLGSDLKENTVAQPEPPLTVPESCNLQHLQQRQQQRRQQPQQLL